MHFVDYVGALSWPILNFAESRHGSWFELCSSDSVSDLVYALDMF